MYMYHHDSYMSVWNKLKYCAHYGNFLFIINVLQDKFGYQYIESSCTITADVYPDSHLSHYSSSYT